MNYSAKKRERQNKKRRLHNRIVKSQNRTMIKSFEASLKEGDQQKAKELLRKVQKQLDSSVSKNVLHKKTAARKLSRLTLRFNKQMSSAS